MNTRVLRLVGIAAAFGFWLLILIFRQRVFPAQITPQLALTELAVILASATAFWMWVGRRLDQSEEQVRDHRQQLEALHDAALSLTSELNLAAVLQRVVDLSRELLHARYGALGVLAENGRELEQFITSGLSFEDQAKIGDLPRGHGLLGLSIREGRAMRIPEIGGHPSSVGFPANHPPMHSLLTAPIVSKGQIIGTIYLTDKLSVDASGREAYHVFSEQDQENLERFATQAAVAIENAQLYRKSEQLAILQERDRIGRDLHDGIIQSLYAIGLMLEDGQHRLATEPETVNKRIDQTIHSLNEVIQNIRDYILNIHPHGFLERGLQEDLEELVRGLRANSFVKVVLEITGDFSTIAPAIRADILHIAREALTNVRKHARATRVDILLYREDGVLTLAIEDDGIGIKTAPSRAGTGHGLDNMHQRAKKMNGDLSIEPIHPHGTSIRLTVPVDACVVEVLDEEEMLH